MKRLLIALAAAVATLTASAIITGTQDFESGRAGFEAADSEEDSSEVVTYASTETAKPTNSLAPYPLQGVDNDASFGDSYLSLDTGDTTVWRTNTVEGNVYFDMTMQFVPSQSAPELEAGTKIAVYQDAASSNIVVLAGPVLDGNPTEYVVGQIDPGTWGRLSVSAVQGAEGFTFKVYLNGTELSTSGESPVSEFPSLTDDTTIANIGFSGSGKLDDFVVRTTDPFIQNPAATIGGEGYASLEDALEDATAESVVVLGADHAAAIAGLAAGTTYKIQKGGYTFGGFTVSGETVLTESTVDGVTTYAAVEGVAQVQGDDNVWKWFGSFADAFTYARAQGYQPNMKFKVGSDFTPGISSSFAVWDLEFIATTDDPITINLANGNAKLVCSTIKFPTTATLNAVSGNVSTMKGGTLNVPSGVVLEMTSYANDGSNWNITGLSGSGTIKNNNVNLYYFLGNTGYNLPSRMRESTWCGTLELSGSNAGSQQWEAEFNGFANANSKVRFNGLTTPLWSSGNDTVAIELVGDGLTIIGEYESARTYTIGGAITGSGALTLSDNTGSLILSGDVSDFIGSVTAAGTTSAITFGSSTTGSGQRIVVGTGNSVAIDSSATWTATNLVLLGELTVNGTLAVAPSSIWCNNGVGVLRYTNKDTLPTTNNFANSWNSKCIIACDPGNKRFVLNDFGNAKSRLEIAGANGVFSALPSTANSGGTAPSINPAVILTANWTVSDGWAAADKVTTFSKLSGSGNLTVNGSSQGTAAIYYTITELDGYTGTLGGNRGAFTVSKVNVATQPTDGARVVATAIGANGSINDNVPLYIGGVDSRATLTYDASGASGAGLYYYEPVVSYDVRFFSDAEKTDQIGETQSVVSGEKATAPAAPTKAGYTFTGWDPDTNTVIEVATDFVAQWSADGYTITFNANGGVDPASTNYTIASGMITLPTPTIALTGVTFGGWTNETYTTPITEFTPAVGNLSSFTLYAKWESSGNPTTIDPANPASTATVAAESPTDAIDKATLATPTGVDAAKYKENFDFDAKPNGDGTYTVTLTGIKDDVKQDVSTDAVKILNGTSENENKVEVPAGLYYKITTMTDIDGTGASSTIGQSTGMGVPVTKPGLTRGFIKVEIGTVPYAAE